MQPLWEVDELILNPLCRCGSWFFMVFSKYVVLELCYLFLSEEGDLEESLGDRKKVRIEYLGGVSQYCYQTEINPVCGSFSIVTHLFFDISWTSWLGLRVHTLHTCNHIFSVRSKRGLECSRHLKFLNNTIASGYELTFTELLQHCCTHWPLKYICVHRIPFSREQLYANMKGQSIAEAILLSYTAFCFSCCAVTGSSGAYWLCSVWVAIPDPGQTVCKQ